MNGPDPARDRGIRRILAARLFHESHAFSPLPTKAGDFTVSRGKAALAEARLADTTLGGIIRGFEMAGAVVDVALAAGGPPGGLVEHDLYLAMRDELVGRARAGGFEAIALELHGAMGTPLCPDAEGDLLRRLRAAVGEEIPIGVGLDLHAHLTPAMIEAADFCVACKENPHSDVSACGEKLAEGILAMLDGRFLPIQTLAKIRMVLPGAQETTGGPLAEIHAEARRLAAEDQAIWDISLCNVYRALDDIDMGQAVVVTSNGAAKSGEAVACRLANAFWEKRAQFVDALLPIHEAIAEAEARIGRERFAWADMGDRVLAGAPGDSTVILAALIDRNGPLRAAIPVTDPVSVQRAKEIGIGGKASFALGGRLTSEFAPLAVDATVLALGGGDFRMRGPYRGGESSSLGASAVLRIGEKLTVIATSRPGFTHDPEAFESLGVAIADQDVVVVKSGYHFALNFAGLATPVLLRTPGIGYYTPGLFAWKRGRFWPEHVVAEPLIAPRTFPCRFTAARHR